MVHPLIKDFSIYCRINDGAIYCRKKISGSLYREILKDGYSFGIGDSVKLNNLYFLFLFLFLFFFFFFFVGVFQFFSFLFFLCLKNLPENHQRGRKRKYYHSSRALVLEKNTFTKNLVFPFFSLQDTHIKILPEDIDDQFSNFPIFQFSTFKLMYFFFFLLIQ